MNRIVWRCSYCIETDIIQIPSGSVLIWSLRCVCVNTLVWLVGWLWPLTKVRKCHRILIILKPRCVFGHSGKLWFLDPGQPPPPPPPPNMRYQQIWLDTDSAPNFFCSKFLPPAYLGGGRYPIPGPGGGWYPIQLTRGGYPIPGPGGEGGVPIQLTRGKYPVPGPGGGWYPIQPTGGGTPSQVQVGWVPIQPMGRG